jgi:hypothetical protein
MRLQDTRSRVPDGVSVNMLLAHSPIMYHEMHDTVRPRVQNYAMQKEMRTNMYLIFWLSMQVLMAMC